MPFKMKGFPAMKETGAMKAMSPKKAMKDPMKAMKDPMKAMKESPNKAMSPKKKNGLDPADKKRKKVLLAKLDSMEDPMNSNQGKTVLKEIKKIDPGFDPESITLS